MKKLLTALVCMCAVIVCAFGFTACGGKKSAAITVYAPDGAPALALAKLMYENPDLGKSVSYTIVGATEISSLVTNNNADKNADLCILPVNTASKLLGTGESYKMLGTVTHGNLFIVANSEADELNADNFADSIDGKKVGIVNMPAFPGAVFKLLLNQYEAADSVTCENVAATAVNGTDNEYDYFVIHEPIASTRVGNANLKLKVVGSLQSLYGENGYPQAVLVAKNSLIENSPEFISAFISEMNDSAEWLLDENVAAQTIIDTISAHFADPENTAPTFDAQNLSKTVVANCAVRFESSQSCKSRVVEFLGALKAAGDATSTAVADSFFYNAD